MTTRLRHHAVALAVCATLIVAEFIALHAIAGPSPAMAAQDTPPPCEPPAEFVKLVPVSL